jgi:hypothetical protein
LLEQVRNGSLSGKLNIKKINRLFLWIILVSFAIMIVTYLVHDVKLNIETAKLIIANVPEIRLENIRFERDMFDSHWRISIPNLERLREVVRVFSVDISREFSNGDTWKISGDNGEYIESSEMATLNEVSGHIVIDGKFYEFYAPCASWEKSGDTVVLSKGVTINGEFGSISAGKARIEDGNLVTVERGEITWNFLSYDIR